MRSNLQNELTSWLGEDLTLLDALSDDELAGLHDAFVTARRGQAKSLAEASDEALRQMPATVRGTVGRILGR